MLPPPEDLDSYAHHLPDTAERLPAASEREQTHGHQPKRKRKPAALANEDV